MYVMRLLWGQPPPDPQNASSVPEMLVPKTQFIKNPDGSETVIAPTMRQSRIYSHINGGRQYASIDDDIWKEISDTCTQRGKHIYAMLHPTYETLPAVITPDVLSRSQHCGHLQHTVKVPTDALRSSGAYWNTANEIIVPVVDLLPAELVQKVSAMPLRMLTVSLVAAKSNWPAAINIQNVHGETYTMALGSTDPTTWTNWIADFVLMRTTRDRNVVLSSSTNPMPSNPALAYYLPPKKDDILALCEDVRWLHRRNIFMRIRKTVTSLVLMSGVIALPQFADMEGDCMYYLLNEEQRTAFMQLLDTVYAGVNPRSQNILIRPACHGSFGEMMMDKHVAPMLVKKMQKRYKAVYPAGRLPEATAAKQLANAEAGQQAPTLPEPIMSTDKQYTLSLIVDVLYAL